MSVHLIKNVCQLVVAIASTSVYGQVHTWQPLGYVQSNLLTNNYSGSDF